MFRASVFGRKNRLFASPSSGNRRSREKDRLLRIELLDDRDMMSAVGPDVAVNLSNGFAITATPLPATGSTASIAQTAFPTPDLLFSSVPGMPIPVVVPNARGWVFEAGGGGFVAPPIENASGYDYPIAIDRGAGGTGASFETKPTIVREAVFDSVLAEFQALAPKSQNSDSAPARPGDTDLSPDVYDEVMASADWSIEPSALRVEISAAA